MLIIEAEDLEAQGVLYQGASEFTFHEKVMVSSLAFSIRLLQTAIDLCQQELDSGHFCLLVKKFNYITVWKEKQVEESEKTDSSEIAPTLIQPAPNAKPAIVNEPELSIAKQRSEDPSPKFSAEPKSHPLASSSFEENYSSYTLSNSLTLAQENDAMATPPQLANTGKTYQPIKPAKPLKHPITFPSPNTLAPNVEQPAEQPAKLDPTFIEHCQQALAYCIGPIAPLIIEEVLANNPPSSPNQMIDSLAQENPKS